MGLSTLGDETLLKIVKEESYAIAHSFICTAAVINGVMVKLNTDGTVSPCAAVTDKPIGFVTVGCKAADERVTVVTPFQAIVYAESDSGSTCGAELAQSGINTAVTNAKMKTAVSTNYVSAVALETATTGNLMQVGILRHPYLKP